MTLTKKTSKKSPDSKRTKKTYDPNKLYDTYTCPSPEDVTPITDYAITLNPSDAHQCFETTKTANRIQTFHTNMFGLVGGILCNYYYSLRLEVSPRGRLHYHGIISFRSKEEILDFFIYSVHLLQKHFMYEIDTIEDRQVWDEYCTKQEHIIGKHELTNKEYNDKIIFKNAPIAKSKKITSY